MNTSTIKVLPKQTVEIEIHVPWEDIKVSYDKVFDTIVKEAEIEGFRKGKAPKKIVAGKIDKTKLYQEVIKEVIPKAYSQALTQHKLVPIISPKIEILKAKENEEWVVKATVALKPIINLKNYKDKIRELKKGQTKIWTPGTKSESQKDQTPKITLEQLMEVMEKEVEVELSDLVLTEEANRLLANLIDQTQKLGLTVEQYLLAKGKTSESIREEYKKQAEKNLKIEFALNEISDIEKITVSQQDIDNLISKVEKIEERERLKKDSYYLAHLIRQQKTLDFLNSL